VSDIHRHLLAATNANTLETYATILGVPRDLLRCRYAAPETVTDPDTVALVIEVKRLDQVERDAVRALLSVLRLYREEGREAGDDTANWTHGLPPHEREALLVAVDLVIDEFVDDVAEVLAGGDLARTAWPGTAEAGPAPVHPLSANEVPGGGSQRGGQDVLAA